MNVRKGGSATHAVSETITRAEADTLSRWNVGGGEKRVGSVDVGDGTDAWLEVHKVHHSAAESTGSTLGRNSGNPPSDTATTCNPSRWQSN